MRTLLVSGVFCAVIGCNKDGGFLWWGDEGGITDSELEAATMLTDDCGSFIYQGDVSNCEQDSEGEYVNCKTSANALLYIKNNGYTAIQGNVTLVSIDGAEDGIFASFQNIRCINGDLTIVNNTELVYSGDVNGQTAEDFLSLTKITGNIAAKGSELPFAELRTIGGSLDFDNTMPTANMDGAPNYGMGSLELIGGKLLIQNVYDPCPGYKECPYEEEMVGMENLLYIGGDIGFHNNQIPQCEIDALAARMREENGLDGTLISSNNTSPRTCE